MLPFLAVAFGIMNRSKIHGWFLFAGRIHRNNCRIMKTVIKKRSCSSALRRRVIVSAFQCSRNIFWRFESIHPATDRQSWPRILEGSVEDGDRILANHGQLCTLLVVQIERICRINIRLKLALSFFFLFCFMITCICLIKIEHEVVLLNSFALLKMWIADGKIGQDKIDWTNTNRITNMPPGMSWNPNLIRPDL